MTTKYGYAASGNWTWDNTNDLNWFLGTGGTGGSTTHPTSTDDVILDGSTGSGTISLGANISAKSVTSGAFAGTLDLAGFSPTFGNWSNSGSGIRTINLGSGTVTLTDTTGNIMLWVTTVNLTLNGASSTISAVANATGVRSLFSGTISLGTGFGSVSIANPSPNNCQVALRFTNGVINNFSATNLRNLVLSNTNTLIVGGTFTYTGTSGNAVYLGSVSTGVQATISVSGAIIINYAMLQDIAKAGSGSITANNSLDGGNNSVTAINSPATATVVGS